MVAMKEERQREVKESVCPAESMMGVWVCGWVGARLSFLTERR